MLNASIKVKLSQEQWHQLYSSVGVALAYKSDEHSDILCQLILYKLAKKLRGKLEENKIEKLTIKPEEAMALLCFFGNETNMFSADWAKGVFVVNRVTQAKLNIELTLLEAKN